MQFDRLIFVSGQGATDPATGRLVGPDTAAQLLITAGDNPDRLGNEARFAKLCGVSPLPASSGKTVRHRLNRSGDRQANRALWTVAFTRLRYCPTTQAYAQRRQHDGKTPKEIIRCLKRYIARELYRRLESPPSAIVST